MNIYLDIVFILQNYDVSMTSLARPCFSFHPMTVEFIVLLIDEVNKVDDCIYFRIIKHCSGMECYLYAQPLNLNTELLRSFQNKSSLRSLDPIKLLHHKTEEHKG